MNKDIDRADLRETLRDTFTVSRYRNLTIAHIARELRLPNAAWKAIAAGILREFPEYPVGPMMDEQCGGWLRTYLTYSVRKGGK
jgi:hypothetical protein